MAPNTRRRCKLLAQAVSAVMTCAVTAAATGQSTVRESLSTEGIEGNFESQYAGVSADGRFVVFSSLANNLVPGDNPVDWDWDVFVRDNQTGVTQRMSVTSAGTPAN